MSSPIIELLRESTIKAIKEQVGYLGTREEQPESFDKDRFAILLSGAKTILNIIESDPISKQGTDNYLRSLDRNQLKYAIESANRIIKEKSSNGKIKLHGVFTSNKPSQWFVNKEDANDFFVQSASEALNDRYPEIKMSSELVPIEEIGEYMEGFDVNAFLAENPERLIK